MATRWVCMRYEYRYDNNNAKINSYNKKAQSEDQGITPKGFWIDAGLIFSARLISLTVLVTDFYSCYIFGNSDQSVLAIWNCFDHPLWTDPCAAMESWISFVTLLKRPIFELEECSADDWKKRQQQRFYQGKQTHTTHTRKGPILAKKSKYWTRFLIRVQPATPPAILSVHVVIEHSWLVYFIKFVCCALLSSTATKCRLTKQRMISTNSQEKVLK